MRFRLPGQQKKKKSMWQAATVQAAIISQNQRHRVRTNPVCATDVRWLMYGKKNAGVGKTPLQRRS